MVYPATVNIIAVVWGGTIYQVPCKCRTMNLGLARQDVDRVYHQPVPEHHVASGQWNKDMLDVVAMVDSWVEAMPGRIRQVQGL